MSEKRDSDEAEIVPTVAGLKAEPVAYPDISVPVPALAAISPASPVPQRQDDDGDGAEEADEAPPAFMRKLEPSAALAAVIGEGPVTRVEAVKRLWEYIRAHGLQAPANPRTIVADEALAAVLGRREVTLFEITGHLMRHLS